VLTTILVSQRGNFGRLNIRSNYWSFYDTVKTQIIGWCAMSLELPPLVKVWSFFLFFMSLKGAGQL